MRYLNPHKFHYQRQNSPHRFRQTWRTFPSNRQSHSGRGTWPRRTVPRAAVETRPRHRRRY